MKIREQIYTDSSERNEILASSYTKFPLSADWRLASAVHAAQRKLNSGYCVSGELPAVCLLLARDPQYSRAFQHPTADAPLSAVIDPAQVQFHSSLIEMRQGLTESPHSNVAPPKDKYIQYTQVY